jgi:iron complex outermembrane receptor protein
MMTRVGVLDLRRCVPPAAIVAWLVSGAPASAQQDDPLRVDLPPVVVTAPKEPADKQKVPASITAVPKATVDAAAITALSEAAALAPNTFFSEFQARKLSFPTFRGITSGPGSPAMTTYVDGVPMIHTNATSLELIEIEQVEFVRGGQSALYGRNALGGIMNVVSTRPSLTKWGGSVTMPVGNYGSWGTRAAISGPVSPRVGINVSGGRSVREGFTRDVSRGVDIDNRGNTFGKAQVLWVPNARWETRVIVGGERARDGDYALVDIGSLRVRPFQTSRDFQGRTARDVVSGTLLVKREGAKVSLSTTTGVVRWDAKDETDLDYSPFPLLTRRNDEDATQFTQEVRLASAPNASIALAGSTRLRWQAGVFYFTQGYSQDAVNTLAPFVLSPQVPLSVRQHSPVASLDDAGFGVYGSGTFTVRDRLELAVGGRMDHEQKDATIRTFLTPPLFPGNTVVADRSFSNVAPQVSVSYHARPDRMLYASVTSGYKAGGFNAVSPSGSEAFEEEQSWQVESGVKTLWLGGRVLANAAVFHIDWADMQLNLPNPQVPAQFYVANVGGARSSGVELELTARAAPGVDVFGVAGFTRGRFKDGSFSSGFQIGGNTLPSTPGYTTTLGAQVQRSLMRGVDLRARGEVAFIGALEYNDLNTAGQDAYALTNLRAGVKKGMLSVDAWIRNAFDTKYIPVAFSYPGLAPSGFVGEMGRPRTFGATLGAQF